VTDDDRPTLGGLFSGIGGFELAWQQSGGRVAWVCEIDPAAQRVLRERFPNVPIYDDVATLDPAEVEPVDVLTGGSPCQGFSVAGRRTGLEHGESRLFADYVRILDGLADRGLSWALWENVPGVLSIENDDGERTFEHVVAALVGADEPVRLARRARWNSGLAARGQRAVSWRVVDSRHFGVPQRRRRVYACVALGRAPEDRAYRALLALPESSSRDPVACEQARPRPRAAAAPRARADGVPTLAGTLTGGGQRGWRVGPDEAAAGHVVPDQASAIVAAMGNGFTGNTQDANVVAVRGDEAHALTGEGHDASEDGTGRGVPIVTGRLDLRNAGREGGSGEGTPGTGLEDGDGPAATLTAGGIPPGVALTYAVEPESGQGADLRARRVEISPAHTATSSNSERGVHVVEPIAYRKSKRAQTEAEDETWVEDGDANTLTPFDQGDARTTHAIVEPLESDEPVAVRMGWGNSRESIRTDDHVGTLATDGAAHVAEPIAPDLAATLTSGVGQNGRHAGRRQEDDVNLAAQAWGVRRLTPIECERLQAFPDGWTEPAGSDSARYRALGNAVTVAVPRWAFGRMLAADRQG
jgi:DNA (cytosine-5)-methyltransferase 1